DDQHDPEPRMDPTRRGAAAEQARQPVEARVEQRQPADHQQDEADRHDPMVDAGTAGVTRDLHRLFAVAMLGGHGLPSRSFSAFSSSSSVTRLAPARRWWTTPNAAVMPRSARPA